MTFKRFFSFLLGMSFFWALSLHGSKHSFARTGGSIVGNGAGLVESNFQYSYLMLPSLIGSCFASKECAPTTSEKILMLKISEIAVQNASNPERLLFVSAASRPGFFDTAPGEKHRLAKTSLTSDQPIFVNTDMLYDDAGKPRLDYPSIISVLIHEIGHQSGEVNHATLDILGAKIRKFAFEMTTPLSVEMENGDKIEVTIVNTNLAARSSDVYVGWHGIGSAKVTTQLTSSLACSNKNAIQTGTEIFNGAFFFTKPFKDATINDVGFSAWIRLHCAAKKNSRATTESYSVRAKIKSDLTLEVVSLEELR